MLTYLDYTLHSLRGNRTLCGYTNTTLLVETVTTDIARKDNDKNALERLGRRIFDRLFTLMERGNSLFWFQIGFIKINSTF